ncbi:MAG: phosphocholine cytidylyltransferase family protein [Bdellovibrionota bacterium]
MRAIILAAGQGTRLKPYTEDRPKCLIEVDGRTILEHQLKNCLRAGVREAVIVTGFRGDLVEQSVAAWRGNGLASLPIKTVFNPRWKDTNNLVSLWSARKYMEEGFVLINGDDVFDHRILTRLTGENHYEIHVCMDRKDRYDDDDMKLLVSEGRVQAINKTIDPARAQGESIGIMKFTREGAGRLLKELEAMVSSPTGNTDWYTKAVERIALSGYGIGAVCIEGLRWAEIDYPEDLAFVRENLSGLFQ